MKIRDLKLSTIFNIIIFILKTGAFPVGPSRLARSKTYPHLLMSETDLLYLEQAKRTGRTFIHIPKCGGTSVKRALRLDLINHPLLSDMLNVGLPSETTVVSIVRNPFDRLISAYEHTRKGERLNCAFKSLVLDNYPDFESFVLEWLTVENSRKWIHFLPQSEFLKVGDRAVAKRIFKLETIDMHWAEIQNIFQISTPLPKENTSNKRLLSEYYKNPKVIERVKSVYSADFRNFGYEQTPPLC